MKSERDRTIALAGIYQAAALVSDIASKGRCDEQARQSSLFSLFQVNPPTVEAVYGGLTGIEKGLRELYRQLEKHSSKDLNRLRYVIQLIQLDGVLRKRSEILETIGKGIAEAERRLEHFDMMHPNITAHFAEVYSNTISTLSPRIMVQGDSLHLNNPDNANLIRALLLTGIRSVRLWRQCGGNRLQIIFGRNKIMRQVESLLAELHEEKILH